MKVLVVKMSSLGDVIHTLPALTDAAQAIPDIRFDWAVEKGFAEIPAWHERVDQVIPIAWRRWRKNLSTAWKNKEPQDFYRTLRATHYDKIIDAQGLLKSAVVARMAKGERCGLDFHSARESLASIFYQKRYAVNYEQHAIVRTRELFAKALGYDVPQSVPDYGILPHFFSSISDQKTIAEPSIIFFHGTTWKTKEWPLHQWIKLAQCCGEAGLKVLLPWGNEEEHLRAKQIAFSAKTAEILPKMTLAQLAELLVQVKAVVAVDTGLGHLAAALNVPTLSIYGPTNPERIGACGENQYHLSAGEPGKGVLEELSSERVWEECQKILESPIIHTIIAEGLQDVSKGRMISHEEMKKHIQKWQK